MLQKQDNICLLDKLVSRGPICESRNFSFITPRGVTGVVVIRALNVWLSTGSVVQESNELAEFNDVTEHTFEHGVNSIIFFSKDKQ